MERSFDMDIIKRPRGLVPGSVEWFRESVGPKLLTRLHDEIEAQTVGEMTPTGARLLTVGLGLIYPTVSAVHHTVEGSLAKVSEVELKNRFEKLMQAHKEQQALEASEAQTVEFIEQPKEVKVG